MPGKPINTERSVNGVYLMGIGNFDTSNIEYLFNLGIKSMYFCCSVLSLVEYINLCIKYKYNYDVLVMYKSAVIPTHTANYLNDLEFLVYCRLPKATFNGKIRDFQAYHKLVDEPDEREAIEKQFYSHVYRTSTSEGRRETKEYLDYELNHPTVKPLRLIIPKIAISSNPGDVVVDMFGGSGSTMIACEKLGRRCLMCEKLPEFVNETLDRWEAYTGLKAKKIEQSPSVGNQPVTE